MFTFVKYSRDEWKAYAEKAHASTFGETLGGDKIDFALLCIDPATDKPVAYATCLENGDHLRVKFGGVLGGHVAQGQGVGTAGYKAGIHWLRGRYRHIKAAVANDNLASIKMHLALNFKIIGVQVFEDEVLLEFHRDLEKT